MQKRHSLRVIHLNLAGLQPLDNHAGTHILRLSRLLRRAVEMIQPQYDRVLPHAPVAAADVLTGSDRLCPVGMYHARRVAGNLLRIFPLIDLLRGKINKPALPERNVRREQIEQTCRVGDRTALPLVPMVIRVKCPQKHCHVRLDAVNHLADAAVVVGKMIGLKYLPHRFCGLRLLRQLEHAVPLFF